MEHKYPNGIQRAFRHNPPGSWMPPLPTGCIRLSAGYPSPSLVPSDEIASAVNRLLQTEGDAPLQYLGSSSMGALREWILRRLLDRGIHTSSQRELLVTAGSAQAIDLIAHVLVDEQTVIAVERPTYMEALEMFRNYTDHIIDVPMDDEGICVDAFEKMLQERVRDGLPVPKFLYTIPSFHNPTGRTMSLERRKSLIRLADAYDFLVVEDDAYGELFFEEAPVPLKALDSGDRVIHLGSLSKVVAPGVRIGWVVASTALVSAFDWFKKDLDHAFVESTVATYLHNVAWEERVAALRDSYRARRDLMHSTLESCMPSSVTWSRPRGGYFMWLHVPGVDTGALLQQALATGVAYVPGRYFYLDPEDGREYLRLSYSYLNPELMVQGVERLAELVTSELNLGFRT